MISVLRKAVELGVTFIDTAETYGPYVNAPGRRTNRAASYSGLGLWTAPRQMGANRSNWDADRQMRGLGWGFSSRIRLDRASHSRGPDPDRIRNESRSTSPRRRTAQPLQRPVPRRGTP